MTKFYKVGRLITFYRDKNANSKSQKYRELLKYEKSLNSLFEGGFFMIMIVANICCILYCITIVKEKPFLLVISILVFILLWIIIFRFGKYKTKKQLEFEEKYFPNINQNEILNYEMDKIILEKYETKFESLIAKITISPDAVIVIGSTTMEIRNWPMEKCSMGFFFAQYANRLGED